MGFKRNNKKQADGIWKESIKKNLLVLQKKEMVHGESKQTMN